MKHYQTALFLIQMIHTWSQNYDFNSFENKVPSDSFSTNYTLTLKPSNKSDLRMFSMNSTINLTQNPISLVNRVSDTFFTGYIKNNSESSTNSLSTRIVNENNKITSEGTNETTSETGSATQTEKSGEYTSKATEETNQTSEANEVTPVTTTTFNVSDFSKSTDIFTLEEFTEFETTTTVTTPELETTSNATTLQLETITSVTTPELETTSNATTLRLDTPTHVTTPELETTSNATTLRLDTPTHVTTPELDTAPDVTTPEFDTTTHVTTPEFDTTTHVTTPEFDTTTHVTTPEFDTATHVTTPEFNTTIHVTTPEPSKPEEITTTEITTEYDIFEPEEKQTPSEFPDFTSKLPEYPKKPKREFNITNNNSWFPLFGDFFFRIYSHKFICKMKQCVRLSIMLNSVENISDSASLFKLFLVLKLNQLHDNDFYHLNDTLNTQILGLFIGEPPAIPYYGILPQDWLDIEEIKPLTQITSPTCKEIKTNSKIWGLPIWAFTFLVIAFVVSLLIISLIVGEIAKRRNRSLEIIE